MRDLHIINKSKSKAPTVYIVFLLLYYRDIHIIFFFSATSKKKQLSMGYFWGKGQEGEVHFLYHFNIVYVLVL